MRKLFGTDGIRGKAGAYPLDGTTLARLGTVLGGPGRSVFICWDTRPSSSSIYSALAAGIESSGGRVVPGGVLPTPAAAVLALHHRFQAAVSISASHNPFEDNGIKIFGPTGKKLPDAEEHAIEREIARSTLSVSHAHRTALPVDTEFVDDYVSLLKRVVHDHGRLRIIIDCANGASAGPAQRLFPDARAEIINVSADGRSINQGCGSLYPAALQRLVVERRADIGIALDGDGDRAIFVDDTGEVRDGDYTLYLLARAMAAVGALPGGLVVTTVMANMGLEAAFAPLGIRTVKTAVGDRYVLAEMEKQGAALGGEQSGHTIRLDLMPTGDGLLTAILVLNLLTASSQPLSALCAPMRKFPQVLLNVRVREKRPLEEVPAVAATASEVERRLGERGRLVLRYSGTEMLARVMIEGEDHDTIQSMAEGLASVITRHIGGDS